MDDVRFGLTLRALRRRLGWTQLVLARRAGVRQQEVSDLERGGVARSRVASARKVAAAIDARVVVDLQWRGGSADRLVDARHARLVERVAAVLIACGWQVRPEVSFAVFGDRGSIDLLGWHEATRSILVIEVKTELTSLEETMRRFDVKLRLASGIAAELLGWRPAVVASVLVLPEATAARRRVADHPTIFAARFPDEGRRVRGWLADPTGQLSAVWFLPIDPHPGDKRVRGGTHRVRTPKSPPKPAAGR